MGGGNGEDGIICKPGVFTEKIKVSGFNRVCLINGSDDIAGNGA